MQLTKLIEELSHVRFGIPGLASTGQTVAAMIILGASTITPAESATNKGSLDEWIVSNAPFGTDYEGFIPGASPSPERIPAPIYDPLMRYTAAYEVDQTLVAAIIWKESKWDIQAVGDSGRSVGLMQLHESGIGYGLTADERMDPERNLEIGIRGFRSYLDRFGSVENALAAFNVGPNAMLEAGGDWQNVAGDYVRAVLSRAAYYREAGLLRDTSSEPEVLLPPIVSAGPGDAMTVPALSADWRPITGPVRKIVEASQLPPAAASQLAGAAEANNAMHDMLDDRQLPTP